MKEKKVTVLAPYSTVSGERLDKIIAQFYKEYSRSHIKNWIINNHVYINGKIENQPDKKIFGQETLTIYPIVKPITNDLPQNIYLNIIYEDNDLLVINKSIGLVVHPGSGNKDNTLLNSLLYHYKANKYLPRCGIVHRLDKNTSGLMVIAKTIYTYYYLVKLLKSKKIIREYQAIVRGDMISGGTINYPIMRHPTKRVCMTVHPLGKFAITHYKIIKRYKLYTHILLRLETGRTHQIRVHMLHMRHPILGDPLYSGINYCSYNKSRNKYNYENKFFSRQALHAHYIEFVHPITKKSMSWSIDLPEDIKNFILYLNK